MQTLRGLAISPGIASGPLFFYQAHVLSADRRQVEDPLAEISRLEAALAKARSDLEAIQVKAVQDTGAKEAEIFSAHLLILEDPDLLEGIIREIKEQRHNIEYAWLQATEHYAGMLASLEDEYLAARSADVRDVAQRVLRILAGEEQMSQQIERPSIIVADELTPSDTVTFDRSKVLGFCTAQGGPTSHVAILAKALGIPAVTGLGAWLETLQNSTYVIVDGDLGVVTLEPDMATRESYRFRSEALQRKFEVAFAAARQPAVSVDGKRIEVVANLGSAVEAASALEFGAEGVGLLRTEFLFLDRQDAPGEDVQVEIYRSILQTFGQQPVVIRTLDIGGDKPAHYLDMKPEMNPFLGVRGMRLALQHPGIFQCQLRALLRAGVGYNLKIMFPMVSSLAEVRAVHLHLRQVRDELEAASRDYARQVEIGIMVEVPSAAVMADVIAPQVDFFSIGTNDLSQYTLASDRTNPEVASLADAFDPSVLRLVRLVSQAAHAHGRWVGLCGELAGDPLATPVLLGLAVDELSMNPRAIPYVKQAIRRFSLPQARAIAEQALQLPTAGEVRSYLENVQGRVP